MKSKTLKSKTLLNKAASALGKSSWRVRLRRHGIEKLRRIAKDNFQRRRGEGICSNL